MVINLSDEHSLLTNWIAELRDVEVQKDRMRFRRNLERIGEVAAYEISKTWPFDEVDVYIGPFQSGVVTVITTVSSDHGQKTIV